MEKIEWLYHRTKHHPAVEGFVRGMALATVGVFAVVLQRLLHDVGFSGRTLVICGAAMGIGLTRRVPVAVILLIAAIAGVVMR